MAKICPQTIFDPPVWAVESLYIQQTPRDKHHSKNQFWADHKNFNFFFIHHITISILDTCVKVKFKTLLPRELDLKKEVNKSSVEISFSHWGCRKNTSDHLTSFGFGLINLKWKVIKFVFLNSEYCVQFWKMGSYDSLWYPNAAPNNYFL